MALNFATTICATVLLLTESLFKRLLHTLTNRTVAQREIRTIIECARTILLAKKLPTRLWAETVNTSVYILNRCISSQTREITSFELWYKEKPNLSHVQKFGSNVFAHVSKKHRKKWDSKSNKLILAGYQGKSINCRLFDLFTNKITVTRDVIINKNLGNDSDIKPDNASIKNCVSR